MRRRVVVALPRPKGTRASSRVELAVTMHPRELEALERRAKSASMALATYVRALLESDPEDVPGAGEKPRRTFSLAELASTGELVGAGVHRKLDVAVVLANPARPAPADVGPSIVELAARELDKLTPDELARADELAGLEAGRELGGMLGAPLVDDDCDTCGENPCSCSFALLPGYRPGQACAHCSRPAPAHHAACAFVVLGRVKRKGSRETLRDERARRRDRRGRVARGGGR